MPNKLADNNAIETLPKRKVKTQLLYIYLIVIFFPLFLIGFYSIRFANKQMLSNYEEQVTSDNKRVKSVLFDTTTAIYNFSEAITTSHRYTSLFSSEDYSSYLTAYDSITELVESYCRNTTSISSVLIYTTNQNLPENSVIKPLSNYSDAPWFSADLESKWDMWETVMEEDTFGNQTPTLTLARRLAVTNKAYSAYLVIRVSTNYLKNRLQNTAYTVFCSVNQSTPFVTPSREWIGHSMTFPESAKVKDDFYSFTGTMKLNNQSVLANISTFLPYKTSDHFYIMVGDTNAYHDLNRILFYYRVILACAICIPTSIIYCFSSRFAARLSCLKHAMHQVRLGDYNIIQQFQGDDELKAIFLDLQSTVKYIYDTEAQFYSVQLKEQQLINNQQKLEFQLLSSQINPHFLYNTLETIRMQALASGNRDVANSVQLLGNSMHYVLENTNTEFISLETELDYINGYLSIQKLRFGKRIDFDVITELDLEPKRYAILPFLLQPIIENAITHGLEQRAFGGYVWVYIHLSEPATMTIEISDNGSGMSVEVLRKLQESLTCHSSLQRSDSIALMNIQQRILLKYGEAYGIHIESKEQSGTHVTITLPVHFMADSKN